MDELDSDDYDFDEMNEVFDLVWIGFKNGLFKCLNFDGIFRCFYLFGCKKQNYVYSELYQYVVGVGKGEWGFVVVGNYCVL